MRKKYENIQLFSSFGFVEMGSEKEAEDAAKALNGTKLLGRQVGDVLADNNNNNNNNAKDDGEIHKGFKWNQTSWKAGW